jgi:hypothetical protein
MTDALNATFDKILQNKEQELIHILENAKKKKNDEPTSETPDNTINYSVKTTLYKINAEQDKKLKSSKAYKNKEQLFSK